MRSSFLGVAVAVMAAAVQTSAQEACCSSDMDCVVLQNADQLAYNDRFGKTLVCDSACPGLINCNMFGLCELCRGCFMTCDGAILYVSETGASEDSISFCDDAEVTEISECYVSSGIGSGSGSGTGSASGSSSASGMASGTGSGTGSGYGSGSASGSAFGTGSGSGSASGSASGSGGGSASGSGSGSGSLAGVSSASASGFGGASSFLQSASASGSASRMTDVPGCTCGDVELEDGEKSFFCENGKSMYCDAECGPESDPADWLFPEMGGLWCQPMGWEGCRLCKLDCTDYPDYCVPCPPGVKIWCDA